MNIKWQSVKLKEKKVRGQEIGEKIGNEFCLQFYEGDPLSKMLFFKI